MALAALDQESGSSISKYLKKSLKKYDAERRQELSVKECLAAVEDLYSHTGLEPPAAWDQALRETLRSENPGETLALPQFCAALTRSKFWEAMLRKGNLKAKRLLGDEGKAAVQAVVRESDGFLIPAELATAYGNLAERLGKPWPPDALRSVAEAQLRARGAQRTADGAAPGLIQPDEFLSLCIAGPYRHLELKPTWWSKLGGKKKGARDGDTARSSTPRSTPRSVTHSVEDLEEDAAPQVQRAALHYTEGWLALAYRDPGGRPRLRRLHLRPHLTPGTDCRRLAERLAAAPGALLPADQLLPLIQRLHRNLATSPEGTDLNGLDDEALRAVKADMDRAFEQTRIKPGDPRWQYRVDVDPPPPTGPSEWDDDF